MSVTKTIRFIGDPVGYRITMDNEWRALERRQWHEVYVGDTDRVVFVDLSKAYLIEDCDEGVAA